MTPILFLYGNMHFLLCFHFFSEIFTQLNFNFINKLCIELKVIQVLQIVPQKMWFWEITTREIKSMGKMQEHIIMPVLRYVIQ